MRFPIRNQILLTFSLILLVCVGFLSVTSAWLAVRQREHTTVEHLRDITATLESSTFPLTTNVLNQMRGLSGAHFVVLQKNGDPSAATIDVGEVDRDVFYAAPKIDQLQAINSGTSMKIADKDFFASRLVRSDGSEESLLVLYPHDNWAAAKRTAAWPPLAIGAATLVVMSLAAGLLTKRLSSRIEKVRGLFRDIAQGEFGEVSAGRNNDEISDLIRSANELSGQIQEMQQTLKKTERMQLLAQLAGGLAHQLRNDITGARLAVQLHERRCRGVAVGRDESLVVALRQLKLTEEHVNRFLSLGRNHHPFNPVPGRLQEILADVETLLRPLSDHAKVSLSVENPTEADTTVNDQDAVRTAVVNLTMNAIEAAGTGGTVRISLRRQAEMTLLDVRDSGDGPLGEMAENLFEPFVSSKPEGVGLGLAIAKQAALNEGGILTWSRDDAQTVFHWQMPTRPVTSENAADPIQNTEVRKRSPQIIEVAVGQACSDVIVK